MMQIDKLASVLSARDKIPECYRERAWELLCRDHPEMAESYRKDVRTLLQALREPSEGMIEAGTSAGISRLHTVDETLTVAEARPLISEAIFTAMIDHLLQESEEQ